MKGLLYSVALKLRPEFAGPLPPVSGHHAYSLILRMIAAADPTLAENLHTDNPRKPLTVSRLMVPTGKGNGSLESQSPACYIRVTLLQESVFEALAQSVLEHPQGSPVTVGDAAFQLEQLATHPKESHLTWSTSFEALLDQPGEPPEFISLRLLSPTVFRSRGRRNVLFPEPGLVFGGLLDKWNAFCPAGLQFRADKERLGAALQVAAVHLATRCLDFGTYRETGATGWCTYSFATTASQEERRRIGALAAFTHYAGVGAKTTMGMGQARARFLRKDRD